MPLKRKTVRDMNFGLIILMFLLALVAISQIEVTILSTYFINIFYQQMPNANPYPNPNPNHEKNDITSV